ncbi:MAG: hypothetical protein RID53_30905 [Coleofasciculus sp. B1-GNL1-01]|uniref:hypothetical protein n=1 Tax=Coleofasciculus sp. B1-GNL1-01 TaxID=3068484 RepID=UPI0032FE2392
MAESTRGGGYAVDTELKIITQTLWIGESFLNEEWVMIGGLRRIEIKRLLAELSTA